MIKEGDCDSSQESYCGITYTVSYRYDKFELSTSSPPLKVGIFDVDDDFPSRYGVVSSSSVTLESETLQQLFFSAGSNDLHFIKKLSSTQYLTNFGVYQIGQQVSHSGFTFTYTSYQSSTPPANLPPVTPPTSGALAYFAPFASIQVTDSSKSVNFIHGEQGFILAAQDATTDFQGVTLYNPVFGIRGLALYPPYDPNVNDHGTLVFQRLESSDYHAIAAEYSQSGSIEYYEVEFSLSFEILHYFLSFSLSLDEFETEKKPGSADSMAFNLF